ncbi:MAG: hypothetical protein JWR51_4065 [Devosia sp.]|uniref:hypothetical protein n=1 Tax=Devosia sp. TaxID=1871048 RepID=UPI002616B9F9|nr:hypothetical protein [Devosia sp.]MDB5530962.1 hypothetical protein [Devosia sp.]
MSTSRRFSKEIGTAFAVLALYLLTILTPLHQARATQLDFAALGYQTIETGWVLCSADTDRSEGKSLVTKCPAAGIGKQQLVAPALAVIAVDAPTMVSVAYVDLPHHRVAPRLNWSAPPRAPPAIA